MTTTVTVDAHGWDVRVSKKNSDTRKNIEKSEVVPKGTKKDFYIWDGQDLYIKEIQPRKPRTKKAPE